MLKSTIECLFPGYPGRGAKTKRRMGSLESSSFIARSGCTEGGEEDPEFPEKEACKQCVMLCTGCEDFYKYVYYV
jgi:hypothetical protein